MSRKQNAQAPQRAAKRGAAAPSDPDAALSPTKPEGYEPVGELVVLAENGGVRVVSDDVRTWKERAA